jgi:hypothetical protein
MSQLPGVLGAGKTGINVNASTITKNRIVGHGTPTATNRQPIDSLHSAGLRKIAGVIQSDVPTGEACTVFDEPGMEVTIESDGTGTIDYGQELVAVAGGSLAAGGRVAPLPGSPTSGTNYEIVGVSISATQVPAVAGSAVKVRWGRRNFQGA